MFKWLNPEKKEPEEQPKPKFIDMQIKGVVFRKCSSDHGRYGPKFHFLIDDEISGTQVTFTIGDCADAALVREGEVLHITYVLRTEYNDYCNVSATMITK
jgi:hypothetical protein